MKTRTVLRIALLAVCMTLSAAYAQGTKTLVNHGPSTVSLTLMVRSGSDPSAQAGTVSIDVPAGATVV